MAELLLADDAPGEAWQGGEYFGRFLWHNATTEQEDGEMISLESLLTEE